MRKPTLTLILLGFILLLSGCSQNDNVTDSAPTASPQKLNTSLQIEAQIVYNMGGPQPVARETFYLLDAEWTSLLPQGDSVENNVRGMVQLNLANLLIRKKHGLETDESTKEAIRMMALALEGTKQYWFPHIVASVKTDFQGRGEFETIRPGQNIPPGEYWVLGMSETRGGFAYWNHKVSVDQGENRLLLDQENAFYAK